MAKLDLTLTNAYEILEDSGITILDILEVVNYINGTSDARTNASENLLAPLEDKVEAPLYLLRTYEQTLAEWYLLGGYDVNYSLWGL